MRVKHTFTVKKSIRRMNVRVQTPILLLFARKHQRSVYV